MATWVRCTTPDGSKVRINADHVAMVRPHKRDRGGSEPRSSLLAARRAQSSYKKIKRT